MICQKLKAYINKCDANILFAFLANLNPENTSFVQQILFNMEKRPLNNPFESLQDFGDLKSLVMHVIESTNIKEVVAILPHNLERKLIDDPAAILPVLDIIVGRATFPYIRHRADYVIAEIKDRIKKVNQDDGLSFEDKFQIFKDAKKLLWHDYQYFDSMNLIRYMSDYEWKIRYSIEIDGQINQEDHNYPSSKLDLNEVHWTNVERSFVIRRHLLFEIIFLIDVEIRRLEEELQETKYTWASEKWEYELYEILLAILISNRVEVIKGSEETFVVDFLRLFNKTDKDFVYYRGKILDRGKPRGKNRTIGTRSLFLKSLQQYLEAYGKPKETTSIRNIPESS